MIRLAVFSDTHGSLARLPAAMEQAGRVDGFLHLGDYASDAPRIAELLPVPYAAVRGNCDYFYGGPEPIPSKRIVTYENASLLMVHGDAFYNTYELAELAEKHACAAALFGHTHVPLLTASGPLLIINPGSLSLPRGGSRSSFAVLTIQGKNVDAKLISL